MKIFTIKLKTILICVFFVCLFVGIVTLSYFYQANKTGSAGLAITVVIDAGHGGVDGGAVGRVSGARESDINLEIAKKLESYLKKYNINVVQTRTNKDGLYKNFGKTYKREDMSARKKIIEENSPDLVISIHQNSFPGASVRGASVYYSELSQSSKAMAEKIKKELENIEECSSSKTAVGDFYMLYCTTAPSVLVECGYLSNAEDEALLISNSYQDKLAFALFCAIAHYFDFIAY